MGDTDAARLRCLQSLYLAANAGDTLMLCRGLVIVGGLEVVAGQFPRAASLFGAEAAGRPDGAPMATLAHPPPTDPELYAEDIAVTRRALGDDAFDVAWAQGADMTLEEPARTILADQPVVHAVSA
jgi:hypothetical protein